MTNINLGKTDTIGCIFACVHTILICIRHYFCTGVNIKIAIYLRIMVVYIVLCVLVTKRAEDYYITNCESFVWSMHARLHLAANVSSKSIRYVHGEDCKGR